jgi:drug/metabolite transporter (DMT)-like permease
MWIILSLVSALCDAGRMSFNKYFSRDFDTMTVAWWSTLAGMPFVAVFAAFTFESLPINNLAFLFPALWGSVAFAAGTMLLVEATKRCDLSIVAPIVAMTPIFIILWEYLLLGTLPNLQGFWGIVLIVVGAYLLNISKIRGWDVLAPFKVILKKDGGLIPFAVAFIYSTGATADKVALQYTDPFSFTVWLFVMSFIFITFIILIFKREALSFDILRKAGPVAASGAVYSINIIANIWAFALASASYVIAVKRTSALFGVLFGYLIFKERKIGERVLGAAVMVTGVAMLAVWG